MRAAVPQDPLQGEDAHHARERLDFMAMVRREILERHGYHVVPRGEERDLLFWLAGAGALSSLVFLVGPSSLKDLLPS